MDATLTHAEPQDAESFPYFGRCDRSRFGVAASCTMTEPHYGLARATAFSLRKSVPHQYGWTHRAILARFRRHRVDERGLIAAPCTPLAFLCVPFGC